VSSARQQLQRFWNRRYSVLGFICGSKLTDLWRNFLGRLWHSTIELQQQGPQDSVTLPALDQVAGDFLIAP
jgi:hypothetical protein